MNLSQNDIPTPNPEFTMERMDGELLLYHPAQTKTVYLNETASLVWQLCDGRRSVHDIVRLLSEAYPQAGTELARDVVDTLHEFHVNGAIALGEQ